MFGLPVAHASFGPHVELEAVVDVDVGPHIELEAGVDVDVGRPVLQLWRPGPSGICNVDVFARRKQSITCTR